MLYDRSYMRGVPGERVVPWLYWVLGVTFAGFVLQNLVGVWGGRPELMDRWFALGVGQLVSGKLWAVFTYALLHGGIWHLVVNGLIIFFTWRMLEPILEGGRIFQAYLGAVFIGGLVYVCVHLGGGTVIGASAGALGLLALYCLMQPDRHITVLLFFILPVTLKPRWLGWFCLGFNGLGFLFIELPRVFNKATMDISSVAYSAHLGGMLGGYLFYRYVVKAGLSGWRLGGRVKVEPPQWMRRKARPPSEGRGFKLNMSSRSDLRKEVDRILDKINSQGFGSLSQQEKDTLDRAKDILKS